jgi:hypothetical protein
VRVISSLPFLSSEKRCAVVPVLRIFSIAAPLPPSDDRTVLGLALRGMLMAGSDMRRDCGPTGMVRMWKLRWRDLSTPCIGCLPSTCTSHHLRAKLNELIHFSMICALAA